MSGSKPDKYNGVDSRDTLYVGFDKQEKRLDRKIKNSIKL